MDRGLKVNFIDYEVKIYNKDSDRVIAVGERLKDHFVINMSPILEKGINVECNNAETKNGNSKDSINNTFNGNISEIWHRRLGHVNYQCIHRMVKENLAVEIKSRIIDNNCDACKTCKLSRNLHKNITHDQSHEILGLLHIDICGPMPVKSIGGSQYILFMINDYSGMYFTHFLKNKSDAFTVFQNFKEKCENILKRKIKCIRTNTGTEFINKDFREFVNKEGIEHQKIVPYNPESNGKVERGNRVILERARTLLYESDLPLRF